MRYFEVSADLTLHDVQVLHTALDHAWENILTADASQLSRKVEVHSLLAVGILRAAIKGKRDIASLSRAGCAHWVAATSFLTDMDSVSLH